MAAATVNWVQEGSDPTVERARVTGDDNDTYVSRRIASIQHVGITSNTDDDADLGATYSGRTVTIRHAAQTANIYSITIVGTP